MDNRNIRKEESAVSPVIGVILMVAITVILAAVIGAFVFGMGTPEKTPAANIEITAAEDGADTITLEHRGGDDLAMDDVKIIVKSEGKSVTFDPAGSSGDAFSAGKEGNITIAASNMSTSWGGEGEQGSPGLTDLNVNKMVEVEFWYNPTGQRIAVISKAIKA
ncbi:MAG: type IV pilin N-terminal domain-containing protein [Methanosarcinales archaeon]|nr:type IV pilin N-terminal domain-containing protein [Methanosarcinales archaeon]